MVDRTATFRKQSIALVPTWLTSLPSESPRSIDSIPPCFFADIEAVKVGRLQPCCTTFLLAYQFLFLARDKGNISESRKTGWTVERLKGYFGKIYRKHSLDKRDRYVRIPWKNGIVNGNANSNWKINIYVLTYEFQSWGMRKKVSSIFNFEISIMNQRINILYIN